MSGNDSIASRKERIQDFIFSRELAEVYLLLDFLSGRCDKTLAMAFDGPDSLMGRPFIEQICEIPWPPNPEEPQLNAKAAATLMLAKDRLSFAAYPASGASIAFSLLVAGDDMTLDKRQRRAQPLSRNDAALDQWKSDVPSRISLARHAFPGIVGSARRFRLYNRVLIVGLLFWLMATCILSWNIAAGHSILVRLDAVKTELATTKKAIASEEDKALAPSRASNLQQAYGTVRYCDRPTSMEQWRLGQSPSAARYRLCDELEANTATLKNVREDLNQWVSTWNIARNVLNLVCGGKGCGTSRSDNAWFVEPRDSKQDAPEVSVAVILLDVLAGAILPIFYGILGAGAATVRDIWAKMRDSLLSPRDLILSLGQLALGAVIGACIGLFVTPSGGSAAGLISGTTAMSASALAFIAGFGVEGVFVALDGLVKRIFNIKEPTTPSHGRTYPSGGRMVPNGEAGAAPQR